MRSLKGDHQVKNHHQELEQLRMEVAHHHDLWRVLEQHAAYQLHCQLLWRGVWLLLRMAGPLHWLALDPILRWHHHLHHPVCQDVHE